MGSTLPWGIQPTPEYLEETAYLTEENKRFEAQLATAQQAASAARAAAVQVCSG